MNKEIQISKRLQMVVGLVTPGKAVADVGCDHAYISIYMLQHQIASKIIAMDVNKGPLQRAKENIMKYGYEQVIETRLSDGMERLQAGEVQTVLIAGMGGPLMERILTANRAVLQSVEELVLQPQSEIPHVREFMEKIGFQIEEEAMLQEDGKYYVAWRASRVSKPEPLGKTIFYEFGKQLLEQQDTTLLQYLKREIQLQESIFEKLQANPTEKSKEKQKEIQKRLTYCKEALAYYEITGN